jgi:hypothetical protein
MRTILISAALLVFSANPAFAIIGGHGHNGGGPKPKYATLQVSNSSDFSIEVSIDSGAFEVVPPGGLVERLYSSTSSEATITARLEGAPGVSDTKTAALAANKTTLATVTATNTTLSISVAKPGNVAKLAREAGVALASGGLLLPLLCLGVLLGRRPQRRERLTESHS